MRMFPDYQAALLNQNSNDISTPSDRTRYFFGIPMEIEPVTLQDSKKARSLSGLFGDDESCIRNVVDRIM